MTGTGTQTDPYVIMTVAELYSMGETGGSEIYFKLGTDIDLNGTPYAEHFESITLNCAGLDGQGHCIRNIVSQSGDKQPIIFNTVARGGTKKVEIKNLRLENIQLTGELTYVFSMKNYGGDYTYLKLYNCVFLLNITQYGTVAGTVKGRSCMTSEYIRDSEAELCTFCFKSVSETHHAFCATMTMKRCHIHFDSYINEAAPAAYAACGLISHSSLSDSYITGRIRYGEKNPDGYRFICSQCGNFDNSFFALNVENGKKLYWDAHFVTVCFYDKDLIPNTAITHTYTSDQVKKFCALTTEQCKSAEYLTSIGFLCAGEE